FESGMTASPASRSQIPTCRFIIIWNLEFGIGNDSIFEPPRGAFSKDVHEFLGKFVGAEQGGGHLADLSPPDERSEASHILAIGRPVEDPLDEVVDLRPDAVGTGDHLLGDLAPRG